MVLLADAHFDFLDLDDSFGLGRIVAPQPHEPRHGRADLAQHLAEQTGILLARPHELVVQGWKVLAGEREEFVHFFGLELPAAVGTTIGASTKPARPQPLAAGAPA
jgi:hypothetical protein